MADLPPPPSGFKVDEAGLPPAPTGYYIDSAPPDRAAPSAVGAQSEPVQSSGAFYGLPKLLPESVQKYVPDFLKGASVGEQLSASGERIAAEQKQLGRPLTLKERLAADPVTQNPVAMGFATHQIGDLPGAVGPSLAGATEKSIRDQFTRAVKPTVAGKQTAGQLDRYQERARDAVSSIVANKPNLRFVDDAGNVRAGELPKSLEDFGDAIDQTKQEIFKKYDAMAKQTGMLGPQVDLRPIIPELNRIATDQVVMDFHPEVAAYAKTRADALLSRGAYWAEDAQRAIQNLNHSLKSFYRNPSYEAAGRANVDSMIANRLREELDTTIEGVAGPGYQELKNQYGALKEIEKDVNNRAQVVARQEKGGGILGRIADVGSAEEVIRGIITFNPVAIARGVGMKSWSEYVKWRRNPNRAVSSLFEQAEGQAQPPKPPVVPSFPVPLGISAADQSNRPGLLGASP